MKPLQINIFKTLLCIGLLLKLSDLGAQNLKITASVDTPSISIGDQVHLDFTIEQPVNAIVAFPQLSGKIGDTIEILYKPKTDTARQEKILKIHYQYLITCFDSGSFVIPPLNVPYKIGDKTDTLHSNSVTLKVTNLPVDTVTQVREIKSPMKAPVIFAEIWPYILVALGVILIIGAVWYYIYRRKKKGNNSIPKKIEPAHIVALRELDKLRSQKLWQSEKTKIYYVNLTDIVRTYISGRFLLPAMEMTSDEIAIEFKHIHSVDPETKDLLNNLFKLADLVKFAKASPLPDENEISMLNAYQFVNNTKLTDPIPSEGDTNTNENGFTSNTSNSFEPNNIQSNSSQVIENNYKINFLAKIILFVKFLGWKIRLFILLILIVLLSTLAVPDLIFNLQKHNSTELSINELKELSDNQIQRYFTVKDAVIPGGAYIEQDKQSKDGSKSLDCILYPVTPALNGENAEPAYIIIKDREVKPDELQSGNYFTNASFKIGGRFSGEHISSDMIKLFADNNISVDSNAIIIEKNALPLSLFLSLTLSVLGILVVILVGISFLSRQMLNTIFVSTKK